MGLQPGGLDDHKDYVKQLIETVAFCKVKHAPSFPGDFVPGILHLFGMYAGIQAVTLSMIALI